MPLTTRIGQLFRSRITMSATSIALLSVILIIGFQNCGKAGFDSGTGETTAQSVNPAASAPFAYEAAVDMITYNSCNSPSSQGKTYNFLAGSYDSKNSTGGAVGQSSIVAKSGVKIRPEFINYAYEVLKPDYPNTDIIASQVQRLLADSELNAKVLPQLSIRSINKSLRLNNVFSKSNTPALGIDVITALGDLANPTWATTLLNNSFPKKSKIEYADFFSGASNSQNSIEAAFHFNTNEQTAEDYRNAFNKIGNIDAQIALGFSYDGEGMLITPETTTTDTMSTAYGRGYQMTFSIPTVYGASPSSWAYHPNNVVSKIEEFDLETGKAVADTTWDCNLKMKIVRAEDAQFEWASLVTAVDTAVTTDASIAAADKATRKEQIIAAQQLYYGRAPADVKAGFCPKMDYLNLMNVPPQTSLYGTGAFAGKTYAEILEMVRRHLPASDWDINLEVGCVVPKKFGCYQENELGVTSDGSYYGKYKVANAVNKGCFHQFDSSYYKANQKDNGVLPVEWCNEYVTICTKR
ncbi:MAG: hypothetical protein B7Y39_19030 [Bdellovibrio sp. 28-41-41]|nr:MAG: hypothetical protein B7Y39_19030 [Bdellovibrio sp. 28-41-41]